MEVPESRVVTLPGDTGDPLGACQDYDRAVAAAGGFDLAILGLGPNGHLGFNEPPAEPEAPTRVVTLTAASLESNARYWDGQAPLQAMTAGMAAILAARKALLLVSGAHKSAILHRSLEGPVTPDVPASFLQLLPSAVVVMDRAAWDSTPS
ncbi:MAG: 6-phosphogluconolactonase, partial [Chloroflexi bacterium]|nr:6-phosphogluconolactonase [Chloroflexota bacterium]